MKIKRSWNDKATLAIPCPECDHKTDELISSLQQNKSFVCGGCGKTIIINGDALAQLEALKTIITKSK